MFIMYGVTSAQANKEELPIGIIKNDKVTGHLKVVDSGKPVNYNGVSGDQVVKLTPGVLARIVLNNTLSGALVLKDGATVLATIPSGTTARTLEYKMEMDTNITVNVGNIADDVTIVYI